MAADLTLRLLADDGTDCAWADAAGSGGRGDLSAAAAAVAGRRVRLVVPGPHVLVTRVAVPATARSKALAAIPWALEDRLAEDVERLHFALGAHHPDTGEWSVAVVARRDLDRWLGACAGAGLQPVSVVPETLALPAPGDGEWVACEADGHVVVRTGGDAGFACEPDMLALVAGRLEPPERIRTLGETRAEWPGPLAARLTPGEPVADAVAAFGDAGEPAAIELLQGDYSRRERAGRQLRRWRAPAILALVLLVATGVHLGLEYRALGAREAALRARMQGLFQQTFPDVQQVSDPRARMAARLRSLREDGGAGGAFLDVLARVGGVVVGGERGEIRGLTWRNGTLELEIAAADLQSLDAIQRGLGEAGLATDLGGVERRDDRVEGRITVEASTP